MSEQERQFYQFGPFSLDPQKRRLLRDGDPVPLSPKAFDTLLVLVQHSGKTVEKDDLMKLVWPDSVVEENNLNQSITALRKSLGDSRHESIFIATIPGIGYRFVADVRKVDGSLETRKLTDPDLVPVPVTDGAARSVDVTTTDVVSRKSTFHPARLALFLLIPLALIVAVYFLFIRQKQQPAPHISSIAVLPLENLSNLPDEEYFADGITDALIGDLAKINELKVISRTSSMHYKGTKKPLPEIARELKVDAVVEGTVQRVGERVRVRAQLIHAATDHHMWIKTYERDVSDIMNLQSEIARTIASEIQIEISPAEQARLAPGRSVNPKALEHYLQGRYLYWNKRTEENLRLAINHFQTAIDQDPQYAVAYTAIADCYNALGSVQFGALPPIEARSLAEKAATRALELNTNLAEAHNALGFVKHYNWNWNAAEQEFKRALELNPSYAAAHNGYASYLMSKGRVEESITASNRARELDPLSLSISVQRGFLLENARRYPEAIEQLNWVIGLDQNHYQALWMLSHTYAANGEVDKAIAAAEKSVAVSERTPGALGILGMIYGFAGRKAEATKILNELRGLTQQRYVTPAALAYVYIGLGEKDRAFEWMEKAYQERSNFIAYLKVVPLVDSLRSDPRFPKLIERVGLPQ